MSILKAPAPIHKVLKLPERKLVISNSSTNKISSKCSESETRYCYWFPGKNKNHPRNLTKTNSSLVTEVSDLQQKVAIYI